MCNCRYLKISVSKVPDKNTYQNFRSTSCIIKKNPANLSLTAQINEAYNNLTGLNANGPTCYYFNNSETECTQCPAYEAK